MALYFSLGKDFLRGLLIMIAWNKVTVDFFPNSSSSSGFSILTKSSKYSSVQINLTKICLHLQNHFLGCELDEISVAKDYLITATDDINYKLNLINHISAMSTLGIATTTPMICAATATYWPNPVPHCPVPFP